MIRESCIMETIAVSYWAGNLPNIVKLHFASFEFNNDLDFKYILFIDEKFINKDIAQLGKDFFLSNQPGLEVRKINLDNLFEKYSIEPFAKWNSNFFYRIMRKFNTNLIKILAKKNLINFIYGSKLHFHKEMGLTFAHNLNFSALIPNLTYRSDAFRSLIANEFPSFNILYTDLDVCFLKKFSTYNWENAFTSAWGISEFANTALLYLPKNIQNTREKILNEFRINSCAWPWVLYSKILCEKFGIEIRDVKEFDPPWTPGSPVYGNSESFMTLNTDLNNLNAWLSDNSFAWHWHNQWNSEPHNQSPYNYYFEKYSKLPRNI